MGLNHQTIQSQHGSSTIFAGVKTLQSLLQRRFYQQSADLAAQSGHHALLYLRNQGAAYTLVQLQDHIAGEAFADDDIGTAVRDLSGLHVTGEIDIGALLQQRIGLLYQSIALLLLHTDIDQCYARILYAHGILIIYTAQTSKLQQMIRSGVHIGTVIYQQGYALGGRDQNAQRRTSHTAHTAHDQLRTYQYGTGAAGRNKSVSLTILDQLQSHYDRGILLLADGRYGSLLAGNHLRSMYDLHTTLVVCICGTLLFQKILRAYQVNFDIGLFLQSLHSTFDDCVRCIVTAHGVQSNF